MSGRFEEALRRIDAAAADDPATEAVDGRAEPATRVYGRRMHAWVERLNPDAPEALRLAARAQHIRRWEIPRDRYPMDRRGYHQWRTTLYTHHADVAEGILREAGYDDATVERVRFLLHKKDLKKDSDTQTLEDAAALVFLEHDLGEFMAREDVDEKKLDRVLRKTWAKMSDAGREAALSLDLGDEATRVIGRATGGGSG